MFSLYAYMTLGFNNPGPNPTDNTHNLVRNSHIQDNNLARSNHSQGRSSHSQGRNRVRSIRNQVRTGSRRTGSPHNKNHHHSH